MKSACITIVVVAMLAACTNKPKPISKNFNKTVVVVNGKKDSVTNNPQKNYGTATVPDVCTKTLLSIVQATDSYKKLTSGKDPKNIVYVMNWVKAETPITRDNGGKITNGVELVVNEKAHGYKIKLASYIYNNEDAGLYYNVGDKYLPLTGMDSLAAKRMRNGCYWGVASHR